MNTDAPLYKQIESELENGILAGVFLPGCRFPSIRALAEQYHVNSNTVQRAVQELRDAGLLASPRGKGTLVTNDADIISCFRQKRSKELTHSFVGQMKALGYSVAEIKSICRGKMCDDG